ncbi:MAG TPA: phosphoribosyltransferase family protein [Desulfuromonadales bacterium]|jgi:predicted phosphoribosyltransferase
MEASDIREIRMLHDRTAVFLDRADGGENLSELLAPLRTVRPLVFGIPAGGVPVAERVAQKLGCCLDVAVVSKVTVPWNTEAGYGAVAFDGTVRLNESLLACLGLSEEQVRQGVERTREKVRRRVELFRGDRPFPDLEGRTVILVDDGLASGFTMLVAVEALRNAGAGRIVVAVPTGHLEAVRKLAEQADQVCCANIRSGWSFAVAAAYRHWRDVSERRAARILARFPQG